MDKINLKFGSRVAVCGGGPIGLLTLQALKMSGTSTLTLIEPIADRRALALKYGADHVIDPVTQNLQEEAEKITNGLGYDIVIDCSGSVHAVEGLPPITAKAGYLLYAAQYPNGYKLPLDLTQYLYFNEITLSGVQVAPYTYPRAIQMLGKYDLDDFVETVFPLDQGPEAFAEQVTGKHVKILIRCNDDIVDPAEDL
jgi:(R,R)-butanediol dehydrogenase/meso-butanediol dehydrogenase/diacetyl reductase/L-iditol 2-dehydrogenase